MMSQTRREFLRASLGASTLVSLSPAVPAFLSRAALDAATPRHADDTVLVVVQLTGGNDGLNTVVPYDDDRYHESRPTLSAVAAKVHKIDAHLGFHPQMEAFMNLYKEGHLCVIQGVGYPNPSGDHAASLRSWQTAKPHQGECQTGWLGRAADTLCDRGGADVPAMFIGQIQQPFTLNAERTVVPSVASVRECTLHAMPGADKARPRRFQTAEIFPGRSGDPLLDFLSRRTAAARGRSRRIGAVAQADPAGKSAAYPSFQIAQEFRVVAELIRADVGVRIYHTELGGGGFGGFDNHANQLGNHCALLHQLSESVAAFVDDLKRDNLLDRVLLMTFSEFGRTVRENGRRGTDHGSAAPLFLAGGRVKGGLVGAHPDLTDLENGGQRFHTDFRRVYATVLDRWLALDSRAVLDETFEPLAVLEV